MLQTLSRELRHIGRTIARAFVDTKPVPVTPEFDRMLLSRRPKMLEVCAPCSGAVHHGLLHRLTPAQQTTFIRWRDTHTLTITGFVARSPRATDRTTCPLCGGQAGSQRPIVEAIPR